MMVQTTEVIYSQVDNSSLTGESVAVSRSNTEGSPNILESQNVAFFSTQCVEGWALGMLVPTYSKLLTNYQSHDILINRLERLVI